MCKDGKQVSIYSLSWIFLVDNVISGISLIHSEVGETKLKLKLKVKRTLNYRSIVDKVIFWNKLIQSEIGETKFKFKFSLNFTKFSRN